jgi:hypothetical protein
MPWLENLRTELPARLTDPHRSSSTVMSTAILGPTILVRRTMDDKSRDLD